MKREQINVMLLIIALIGVCFNIYRYYFASIINKPEFIILDIKTFNNLEPLTIVHYRIKNVGNAPAHQVSTMISSINGSKSLPAFFEKIDIGESVSVNLRIKCDQYTQLKVEISCFELGDVKFYDVQATNESEIFFNPDFIVYNLSYRFITQGNQTITEAEFWILNIGSPAHNINVSLGSSSYSIISYLSHGEAKKIIMNTTSTIWLGIHVDITCDEGVKQTHYLTRYDL